MLVDEEGYIIAHGDMIIPPRKKYRIPNIMNMHITRKEPKVAATLLDWGEMIKTSCVHPNLMMETISYQIKKGIHIGNQDNRARRDGIEIYHIKQTNVFLIVMRIFEEVDLDIYCVCSNWKSKTLPECQMRPRTSCECPCNKYSNILICNEDTSSDSKLCSTVVSVNRYEPLHYGEVAERKHLKPCYQFKCASRTTFLQCHKQAGCRWCSVGEDGIDLGDKSFCGEVQICHFGMVGHYGLLHDVKKWEVSDFNWLYIQVAAIVVSILGFFFLFISIINSRSEDDEKTLTTKLSTHFHYLSNSSSVMSGTVTPRSRSASFSSLGSLSTAHYTSRCAPPRLKLLQDASKGLVKAATQDIVQVAIAEELRQRRCIGQKYVLTADDRCGTPRDVAASRTNKSNRRVRRRSGTAFARCVTVVGVAHEGRR
ncbi:hypothetical protein LSAT2_006600 [Lamellibrachia satsuma]|nr:hypothetical protein LSAT2_006600 [Lamellibrachia satsuma]